MIQAVVFDLDGTLLDSMHAWDHVGERYLDSLHIKAETGLKDILADMSLAQSASYIKEHYALTLSLDEIQQGIEDCVLYRYETDLQLKSGVEECLKRCIAKQWKLCVLSASSHAMVTSALQRCGILDLFSFIITCDDAQVPKSDPRIYEMVLDKLKVTKEDCIFIDDAYYAIKQMKEQGCRVYAVYDEANKSDWEAICKVSDQHFMSLSQWEV